MRSHFAHKKHIISEPCVLKGQTLWSLANGFRWKRRSLPFGKESCRGAAENTYDREKLEWTELYAST